LSVGFALQRLANLSRDEDQLWELSSPSEAAKAALLAFSLTDTALSLPR
jgi:hypothetical protein